MYKHPIISFLSGLIVCGFVLALICFLLLCLTFNLAGGETLSQTENLRTAYLILTLLLSVFATVIIRAFLRRNKKFTVLGIAILPIVVTVIVTVYYVENINFHTDFNKSVWKPMKWKPFSMSATLVKEHTLIGLTRKQVYDMLGEASEENGMSNDEKDAISYFIENSWTMIIYFEKDRVVSTDLRQPLLCV